MVTRKTLIVFVKSYLLLKRERDMLIEVQSSTEFIPLFYSTKTAPLFRLEPPNAAGGSVSRVEFLVDFIYL